MQRELLTSLSSPFETIWEARGLPQPCRVEFAGWRWDNNERRVQCASATLQRMCLPNSGLQFGSAETF